MARKNTDWMPYRHIDIVGNARKTINALNITGMRAHLGFTSGSPQGDWIDGVLIPAYNELLAAYNDWADESCRTMIKTNALVKAEAVFIPIYRRFYSGMMKGNPLAESSDFLEMGFPTPREGGYKRAAKPETSPYATVRYPELYMIEIHISDENFRRAKPHGVKAAEIAWVIGETTPASFEDFTHSAFVTRSPYRLTFDIDMRGKTVYFVVRWINTRGVTGAWSHTCNAIIP